jgi:hypothetical protein
MELESGGQLGRFGDAGRFERGGDLGERRTGVRMEDVAEHGVPEHLGNERDLVDERHRIDRRTEPRVILV